jgi:hypothetical protein
MTEYMQHTQNEVDDMCGKQSEIQMNKHEKHIQVGYPIKN